MELRDDFYLYKSISVCMYWLERGSANFCKGSACEPTQTRTSASRQGDVPRKSYLERAGVHLARGLRFASPVVGATAWRRTLLNVGSLHALERDLACLSAHILS